MKSRSAARMGCAKYLSLWLLVLVSILCIAKEKVAVDALSAAPGFSTYAQPDGSETVPLMIRGDDTLQTWFQTKEDFSVIHDPKTRYFVYGIFNRETGLLDPTPHKADPSTNPHKLGLFRDEAPELRAVHDGAGEDTVENVERRLHTVETDLLCDFGGTAENPCDLPTLTLLVRFQNHKDRKLNSRDDFDTLFNSVGVSGTEILPSGSVRDIFLENSYGKHDMSTTVTDWITVSYSEQAAAGYGNSGIGAHSRPAWSEALTTLDSMNVVDFDSFDSDGNDRMDGLNIIHSGVEAAVGMADCETGELHEERIWSHAANSSFWQASNGVRTGPYYVASGVSGICPPLGPGEQWKIARIGVLAHEAFHDLGLLDLYDVHIGVGTGFYDLMSSSWGWSGTQIYPPHLSAWSKKALGWSNVVEVTREAGGPKHISQDYTLGPACEDPTVLMITHNMPAGEYFLIENRYGCGFDKEFDDINEGNPALHFFGIALWHIDETDPSRFHRTSHGECSYGACPEHYRTALVQADGEWHLEQGYLIDNHGDGGDLFKKGAAYGNVAYKIDDFGITLNDGTTRLEPNTQSYSNVVEMLTGISIEVLSTGRDSTVRVTLTDDIQLPAGWTSYPTPAPTPEPLPTTPLPTPAPTPQPTEQGSKLITIQFKTDGYGEDTGIIITDLDTDEKKLDMPAKSYSGKNNQVVNQEAWVTEGHEMEMVFLDEYGDGIPNGYYAVYWGNPADGVELVPPNHNFKKANSADPPLLFAKETFMAAGPATPGERAGETPATPQPTPVPTPSPTPVPTPVPTDGLEVPDNMNVFRIEIRSDKYLEDVGWEMEAMDGDFSFERAEGYYTGAGGFTNGYGGVIVEHVLVPKTFGQLRFHMHDKYGDGTATNYLIDGQAGYYCVIFGEDHDENNILVLNENFGSETEYHDFQNAPANMQHVVEVTDKPTTSPTKSPTKSPTASPTASPTIKATIPPVNGIEFEFEVVFAPFEQAITPAVIPALKNFVEKELDAYILSFNEAETVYFDVEIESQTLGGDQGLTVRFDAQVISDEEGRRRLEAIVRKDDENWSFWSRKGLEQSGVLERLRNEVGNGFFSNVMIFQGVSEDDDPTCDDHPTFQWFLGSTQKNCRHVEHASDQQRKEWCTAYPDVKANCEESCGQCGFDDGCYDDDEQTFLVQRYQRNCLWVRKRLDYAFIEKYCATTDAKYICQETCENCEPLVQNPPTAAPIPDDGKCEDHDDKTFMFYGKPRNCGYVRRTQHHSWIGDTVCSETFAGHACEYTCGACMTGCQDSETFRFVANNADRNCGWLFGHVNRRKNHCSGDVALNCPRACYMCDSA